MPNPINEQHDHSLLVKQRGKLTPVDKIFIALLKKLDQIKHRYAGNTDISAAIETLTQKIVAGQIPNAIILNETLDTAEVDSENQALLHSKKIEDEINDCLNKARESYEKYQQKLFNHFKEVTEAYNTYLKIGIGVGGYYNRLFRSYAYHDRSRWLERADAKAFIRVIDKIALINTDTQWLENFYYKHFKTNTSFDHQAQLKLLKDVYDFFTQMQKNHQAAMVTRQQHIKDKLLAAYANGAFARHASQWITLNHKQAFTAEQLKEYRGDIQKIYQDFTIPESEQKGLRLLADIEVLNKETAELMAAFNAQAKKFKQEIHHLAEQLGVPRCIVNRHKHPQTRGGRTVDSVYTYYVPYNAQGELSYLHAKTSVSEEVQARRQIQSQNKKLAWHSSIVVGFGEACVAASGILLAFTILPELVIIPIVGFAAGYINRLLFNRDIRDCFDELRLTKTIDGKKHRRLFVNDKGEAIVGSKKAAIIIGGFSCVFVGFVTGALSFLSTSGQLVGLLAPLLSNPVVITVLCGAGAAFPALGVAIGVTCIFFTVIADFIKNDRATQVANYVKKTFWDRPTAWQEMSLMEKVNYNGRIAAKALVITAAVAFTVAATVFSFGMLYTSSLDVIRLAAAPNSVGRVMASISAWTNAVISTPFQVKASYTILNSLIPRANTFADLSDAKDTQPKPSFFQRLWYGTKLTTKNLVQHSDAQVSQFKSAVAVATASVNGFAIGTVYIDPVSAGATTASILSTGGLSMACNTNAAIQAVNARHNVTPIAEAISLELVTKKTDADTIPCDHADAANSIKRLVPILVPLEGSSKKKNSGIVYV